MPGYNPTAQFLLNGQVAPPCDSAPPCSGVVTTTTTTAATTTAATATALTTTTDGDHACTVSDPCPNTTLCTVTGVTLHEFNPNQITGCPKKMVTRLFEMSWR